MRTPIAVASLLICSVLAGCNCAMPVDELTDAGTSTGGGRATGGSSAVTGGGSAVTGGGSGVDAGQCEPAPSGIIGWWDGDLISGTTASSRVNSFHGTMLTGATVDAGVVGQAFSFAPGGAIEVPFDSAFLPANGLTAELWVRPAGPQPAFARLIGVQLDNSFASSWLFGIGQSNSLYFGLFQNNSQTYIDQTSSIGSGVWHHVAATWNGTDMVVYLDGVQVGTLGFTGPLQASSYTLRIGRGESASYQFTGEIDELTLYNRALTANEVQRIFAVGALGKCKNTPQ